MIGLGPMAVLLLLLWLGAPGFFAAAFAVALMVIVTGAMARTRWRMRRTGCFGAAISRNASTS